MKHLFNFLLGISFRSATFYLLFGDYLPYFRIFMPRLFVLHLFANGFVFPLSISHASFFHQFFFRPFFSLVPKQKLSRRKSAAEKWKTKLTKTKIFLVCRSCIENVNV